MTDPDPRVPGQGAPDDAPDDAPGARSAPEGEWVVGARARPAVEVDAVAQAAARRRARLEARLAVYARYASVVADEAAAALDGSGDRVRSLAAQRQSLEEQWRELHDAGDPPGALPFDQALAGALHELDGQSAVEVALRQRLASLHADAAHVASRLLAAGDDAPAGSPPRHQSATTALARRHPPAAPDTHATRAESDALDAVLADADAAARAGAMGEAVAGTLGGPLGGPLGRVYPGVVSRTDPAAYGRVEARPPAPPPTRLNVRF